MVKILYWSCDINDDNARQKSKNYFKVKCAVKKIDNYFKI